MLISFLTFSHWNLLSVIKNGHSKENLEIHRNWDWYWKIIMFIKTAFSTTHKHYTRKDLNWCKNPQIFCMTETRDPWATSLTRKKFQSLNTFLQSYDYTIMLNKKKKRIIISFVKALLYVHYYMYLPLEKVVTLHLNKLQSPSPNDALCQV